MSDEKQYDIAITIGCFDLFHEGHMILLDRMRELAYRVIVIIHDDVGIWKLKGHIPIHASKQRTRNLYSIGGAHHVEIARGTDPTEALEAMIESEKDNRIIYARGDDMPDFPGQQTLNDAGIPIKLFPYTKGVSSTQRRRELTGPGL